MSVSHSLEAVMSEIREDSTPAKSFPGLQMDASLLCPHMAERDHFSPVSSCKRNTNPIQKGSTLMTQLPPRGPPPNTTTLGD